MSDGSTRGLLMECSKNNFDQSKYLDGEFLEVENHTLGYTFQTNVSNVEPGDIYSAPFTGHKQIQKWVQHDFLHRGKNMKRIEFGLEVSYTPKFARSDLINPIMRMENRDELDMTANISG